MPLNERCCKWKCYRLEEAVKAWGRCYPDCNIPTNTTLPLFVEKVEADVSGVKQISCNRNTVLLSCGVEHSVTSDSDFYRLGMRKLFCFEVFSRFDRSPPCDRDRRTDTGRQHVQCESRTVKTQIYPVLISALEILYPIDQIL